MARRNNFLSLLLVALGCAFVSQAFVSPVKGSAPEVDARVLGATFAGLAPLAVEQPANAYDSVVAMLQSWLVGKAEDRLETSRCTGDEVQPRWNSHMAAQVESPWS
eukprot:Skav231871  [mRNA]  locus=scaffold54:64822:67420:- [translate_table: standard]